jgi:predicted DsbA family dithiol-disulfide isomerase
MLDIMKIATLVVCAGLLAGFGAGARYARVQAGSPAPALSQSAPSQSQAGTRGPSGVAAKIGKEDITEQELEKAVGARLMTLRTEEYEVRRAALEELIGERLMKAEAAKRGVSLADLIKTEIDAKVTPPAATEINAILEANRSRLGSMSEDEARKSIATQLARRGREARKTALVSELTAKSEVRILLDPPRLNEAFDPAAPARGAKDAPVTIVEFSDFQCPYCSRSYATMKQLMERYPTQVKWVFRDFPLPIHQDAQPAAVAARCAAEQNKFWEMHDLLFQNQRDLSAAALTRYGTDVGLKAEAYAACRAAGKAGEGIQKDLEAGQEFGVTGTPAFFINGRFLNGARPIESFTQIIDEELAMGQPKAGAAER